MTRYAAVLICFYFAISGNVHAQMAGEKIFDNTKIHEINIQSLFESLEDSLSKNYLLSFGLGQIQIRKIPYTYALVSIDNIPLDTIGIRYKGFNSWWSSDKKPLKIDINKYKDQAYDGLTKFNLHNGAGDPSFIRENISYRILRELGIKAPRTSYAKVFIDTKYLGLYRIVEQVDNTFLDVNFGNHDGNLYVQQSSGSGGYTFDWLGSDQANYYESLELENHQKTNDWSSLIHFFDVVNNASEETFKGEIASLFDVDEYLQILAFDVAVNNIDWYGFSGRNYYLADVNGKFHWIPWDYNLSWRENPNQINIKPEEYPILIKRLLSIPEYYDAFIEKYCSLLPYLSTSSIETTIASETLNIKALIESDPYTEYPYEAFVKNLESSWGQLPGLKEFASARYQDIEQTIHNLDKDCDAITGIPDNAQLILSFPNPANEMLRFNPDVALPFAISIRNSMGQTVFENNIFKENFLDVRNFSAGMYFLKIKNRHLSISQSFQILH
jgi:hypothetical protein